MTESLVKGRYYAVAPDDLTLLSDNPLRSTKNQELMVNDALNKVNLDAIKVQTDKLQFDGSNNLKCKVY